MNFHAFLRRNFMVIIMRKTEAIVQQVGKAFVGNNPVIYKILLAMLAGGHILLEDIPGVGKTTLAVAFSRAMHLQYNRVQFTPDVMPSDITGFAMYRKDTGRMEYQPGAALCNLLLADELNRAPSRSQAALLEAMEEYSVTVDGETHPLPKPFMVIATQNPTGSAGTQLLPESQMDRFMMRLSLGYPEPEGEAEMLRRKHGDAEAQAVQPITNADELMAMRQQVAHTYISDDVYNYIVALVCATRNHPAIQQGVSPRCSVALMALAQAAAFVIGRDYVIPSDVQAIFADCAAHRLILAPATRGVQGGAAKLLQEILAKTPAPAPENPQ